jgi:hypothetical protein
VITPGLKQAFASDHIRLDHFLWKPCLGFIGNIVFDKILIDIPRNYCKGGLVILLNVPFRDG